MTGKEDAMRTNYMMTVDDVMEELGVKRSKAYSVLKQLNDELAKEGIAIIMVSSELPEIINMCDNVCVIRAGKLVGKLGKDQMNQEEIMKYAAGGVE